MDSKDEIRMQHALMDYDHQIKFYSDVLRSDASEEDKAFARKMIEESEAGKRQVQVIAAHKHSSKHRAELEKSEKCGCFFCLRIYSPSEIEDWTDGENTAICPYCSVDSVIGDASGYPITKEFLQEMRNYWFRIV